MLDDYPILKDRLHALAVFSGIAIAAVSGFDMIISGGFDFLTPGRAVREVAPSAYVTVMQTPWSPEGRVIPLSSNEPLFAGEAYAAADEDLAGARDDASAPSGVSGGYPARTQEDVYRDIAALYEDMEATPSSYATTEYRPSDDATEDDLKPKDGDVSVY